MTKKELQALAVRALGEGVTVTMLHDPGWGGIRTAQVHGPDEWLAVCVRVCGAGNKGKAVAAHTLAAALRALAGEE